MPQQSPIRLIHGIADGFASHIVGLSDIDRNDALLMARGNRRGLRTHQEVKGQALLCVFADT